LIFAQYFLKQYVWDHHPTWKRYIKWLLVVALLCFYWRWYDHWYCWASLRISFFNI